MYEDIGLEIYEIVNILGFILGLAFGVIAQKTQFCFSGCIKDFILTRSTKRAASVIMAMIVAVGVTNIVVYLNGIDLTQSYFFRSDINYFAIVLGGILFGIGMTLADGCSSRHLVKFAQGNINSLITIIFIAIFAYATTKGILNTPVRYITDNSFLIELSSLLANERVSIYLILGLLLSLLWIFTKKIKRILSLYDGVLIGLFIAAGWYITGIIGLESIEREIGFSSLSFVYPTAQSLELFSYYQVNNINFGISIVFGVVLGAFLMSKINKRYSFGCTSIIKGNNITYNMLGGALMGVGGVISIGCTVGQGLSGLSTLAFASILAILSIMISGFITAQYLNKRDKLPMCFVFEWND